MKNTKQRQIILSIINNSNEHLDAYEIYERAKENIKNIILLGENVNTELKEATNWLPKSAFESVCSFLNTTGGYIILGANDSLL